MTTLYTRVSILSLVALLIAGCATAARYQLDELYGQSHVVDRSVSPELEQAAYLRSSASTDPALQASSPLEPEFYRDIKPIVDSRCVVCHGCYDAPCQFKMTSFESIDRGAHKDKVYNGTRLLEASLTHLNIGVNTTQQWRDEGFFSVLNEREQSRAANVQASVLHRMLQLKKAHPLPAGDILPKSFDLSLDRDQECSKIEEFDRFAKKRPLWGMPYGLPAIEDENRLKLESWIESGAKSRASNRRPTHHQNEIESWEAFLNGKSLKQQLMSRYIYEHLFLAHLYFSKNFLAATDEREFFKLVRSKTAPGQMIDEISTRRPFDDPGGEFYYRLLRVESTIVAKQHMPYALNPTRLERWTDLFLTADYQVAQLPSYQPELASNPFITFQALPVNSRYRFMLDEARFSIMGFIRGPVCRGQVALNVINDHFWVLFVDPEVEVEYASGEFLAREAKDLMLPAERGSTALLPLSSWLKYSNMQQQYLTAKERRFDQIFTDDKRLDTSFLWHGDGDNSNAALTVYRHFDSSSVIKGLSGKTPKTAWVIDYSLLERIHYLLVAGFDVYGNAGHQLLTRLYMDFLRMEGEYAFLSLLPNDLAQQQLSFWYRGEESQVERYLERLDDGKYETTAIKYLTNNPKKELFNLFRKEVGSEVIKADVINTRPHLKVEKSYQQPLQRLSDIEGTRLRFLSEQSLMRLSLNSGEQLLISLVLNRAHTNVSHLYREEQRLIPAEYTLSVIENVVGTYPNVFFDVKEKDLDGFVDRVARLESEQDYADLVTQFGIRRTHKKFWNFSDSIHENYRKEKPVEAGFLDFNRLDNR